MIKSLDHVAIAVPELDEAIRRFVDDLGVALDHVEDVPAAQTTTAFLPIGGPTTVELVTPLAGAGPIAKALETRGPGLHHLCFRTDDLDGDVARLRAKGWRFTTEQPTGGAHGTRVMWVHPKSGGGVLIELAEHPEDRVGATPSSHGSEDGSVPSHRSEDGSVPSHRSEDGSVPSHRSEEP